MDTIYSDQTKAANRALSEFLCAVQYEDIPHAVVLRTEDLFLDWFASALAGKDARPTRVMEQFAAVMGPHSGPSEILVSRKRTSPVFAALINGAASHVVEQDDLHN
ncbi:MAG TPA: MmgE/PrpD family protein, partial [Burkholderiales bacterium]|nr:MmgE/PrpD family protein [Burkholderiales bacterium]